jgi:16S rRNA (guanine527-N7)-methyltransferase
MNDARLRSLLQAELSHAAIDLPDGAIERLLLHASLLVKWNKAVRLVGSTDPETIVRRHIVESLALLPFIHEPRGGLLDIGSGNGYPAVPLKCALPDLRLAMMEPTMRKAVFLRTVVADLRLTDAEVLRDRVDRPADLARYGKWDCITMRAVAAIPAIMTGASVALRPGGRLLFMVGDAGRDQVLRGLRGALTVLGDSRLPGTKASHLLVVGAGAVMPPGSETIH